MLVWLSLISWYIQLEKLLETINVLTAVRISHFGHGAKGRSVLLYPFNTNNLYDIVMTILIHCIYC